MNYKLDNKDLIICLAFLQKSKTILKVKSKKAKDYYFNLDKSKEGLLYYSLPFELQNILSLYIFSDTKPVIFYFKGNEYTIPDVVTLKKFIDEIILKEAKVSDDDIFKDYTNMDNVLRNIIRRRVYYQLGDLSEIRKEFSEIGFEPTKEEVKNYALGELKRYIKMEKNYSEYLNNKVKKRDLILNDKKISDYFDTQTVLDNINIYDVLNYYNIRYKNSQGNEILCHSPFRKDKHPSFCINKETMLWIDFASSEKGNIISLVGMLENLDTKNNFKDILKILKKM